MLKIKLLTSLIFLLFSLSAFSQIEYYKENFWQAERFYQNGEKVKFKHIESILKKSPRAHAEYLKGKTDSRLAGISTLLGIGSWVVGGIKRLNVNETNTNTNTNTVGYDIGAAGGYLLAFYFYRKEAKHYRNASIIYNNDDLGNTGILISPTITGNGIGLSVKF